jgi:hypothetical protein
MIVCLYKSIYVLYYSFFFILLFGDVADIKIINLFLIHIYVYVPFYNYNLLIKFLIFTTLTIDSVLIFT